ncbi:hypothetical protein BDZ97DRAFT_1802022, partial [Flammula alnicola]
EKQERQELDQEAQEAQDDQPRDEPDQQALYEQQELEQELAEQEQAEQEQDEQEQELEQDEPLPQTNPLPELSAKEIASRDIVAIADLFSIMKTTLATMTGAFDRLGTQTEKMVSHSLDIKAAEQLRQIKSALEEQIARHKAEVEALRSTLHTKIKEAVEEKIRDHMQDVIKNSVQQVIEEKVHYQLSIQIPEDLRQQVISHKRQILEVKASLHNSEARRYNALQTIPSLNAPLRPLLRPLPTPEQSPVVIAISRSSSMGNSTLTTVTPTTAFPQGPAPTPIRRTVSNSFRMGLTVPDTVPPSPSPFFPRDMTTLFALNPEETRRLLREYGLSSAAGSPATEHPTRPRGLSIVDEAAEEDPDAHARDLNKFMAHIGVPYLMIPAPKEKHAESAPLSSKSRRKLLTPLIIK